ncbi:MAG: hypothetical protein WCD12_19210 [Candidatus Binatus sp.]|uniref:hypothetical protein n=1 Tax=Candidatus Binatus sp. TaxID=2811406 RepID=UPI003C713193
MPRERTLLVAESPDRRDRYGILALSIYLIFSILIFGRALVGHFRDTYIGIGPDPSMYMWFYVWWPQALIHRLDPFFTHVIYAPNGINLAWTCGVPLASFLAWPLTASVGPIAAFNVLCLVTLPLDAWAAFVLCRYICKAWWPSLLGGYIFGFSAYVLGQQSCGSPNLTMAFLVPLALFLVVRAIARELTPRRLVATLAVLLVLQFLISIEIFATMTAIGGMALLLGWSFADADLGKRILRQLPPITVAYAVALAAVGPYLYYLFALGSPKGQIWSLHACSADLLNFIIPAPTNALGAIPGIDRLAATFDTCGIAEVDAYIGLPLIILAAAYARRHWREPIGKLLVDSLIITCVLALGPLLHFHGAVLGGLPGKILGVMPALDKAMPARFMMFSFLLLAIIAAIWFAANQIGSATKIAFAAIIVVSTLPNLSGSYWTSRDDSPAFFTTALHRQYLASGENALVLPFGIRGNSMLWQAETAMYFRLAGGYTGQLPPEFREWPIVGAFLTAAYLPDAGAQMNAFMAHHAVNTVIVADDDPNAQAWHALASACCTTAQTVGGVTIYRAAPDALKPYAQVTALEMSRRADSVMFDTLVLAADRWLSDGNSLAGLTPLEAQRKGLLPDSWLTGPTAGGWSIQENPVTDPGGRYRLGAWLGPMPEGHASVGVYGSYAALEPIIQTYRHGALRVYFPYPHNLADGAVDARIAAMHGLMVVEFEREQLAAAAAQVRASASTTGSTTGAPAILTGTNAR